LISLLPDDAAAQASARPHAKTKRPVEDVYQIVKIDSHEGYEIRHLLDCIVDADSFQEYKAEFGKSLVAGYARIEGMPVGIVANQRVQTVTGRGEVEIGGVIYADSADKAARFIMDCNQMKVPLVFLQDVMGFMVGKEAEQSGIIRSGAKLVNALSNSIVPKITVVVGNSFGAGNYALCGKAYDPSFIFSWPNAKYAVMGAEQAATTLFSVQAKAAERKGEALDQSSADQKHAEIKKRYEQQMDIRYGAARGWIDAIIPPHHTRNVLAKCLKLASRASGNGQKTFHTGVIQV
jgi:3-methylcrotonyl-CoA carboxylase beta subunit